MNGEETLLKEHVDSYIHAKNLLDEHKTKVAERVEYIARILDEHRDRCSEEYWDCDLGEIWYEGDGGIVERNGVTKFDISDSHISICTYRDNRGFPLAEYGSVEFDFPISYLYGDTKFDNIRAELDEYNKLKKLEYKKQVEERKNQKENEERRELARLKEKYNNDVK